jgi:hypothetical protein
MSKTLMDSVERLSNEAIELRRVLRKSTRALWFSYFIGVFAVLAFSLTGYIAVLRVSNIADRNNDRICAIIKVLEPVPGEDISTERSTRIAQAARQLNCK